MFEFEDINLEDIHLADYNPRVISEDEYIKLKNSIREYGLVDPIIVNLKTMTIIGGHQRYEVLDNEYAQKGIALSLKLLRRGDIGWVFTDNNLTIKNDAYEKGLNIALNKISGEWDYPKLNTLLDELMDIDDFDVSLTGFDNLSDVQSWEIDIDDFDIGDGLEEDNVFEGKSLQLVVHFEDEQSQKELYEELREEGYICKLS